MQESRQEERRDWMDIRFTAVLQAETEYAGVVARFKIYRHEGENEDGSPCFWKSGDMCNLPGTADHAEAEVTLEGSIKWDGCSDWNELDFHGCSREHVAHVGVMMLRVFDWAKELGMDRF